MIYFMRADEDGPVKIGWSKNPVTRSFQVKPTPLTELTIIRLIDGPPWGEKWLHQEFAANRLHPKREWFCFDEQMLTIELPAEKPANVTAGMANLSTVITEQITIRLSKARVEALKQAAKAEHRSLAQQVEHLLASIDDPAPPLPPADPFSLESLREFGEQFERLGHNGGPFTDPEPIEERTIEPDPDYGFRPTEFAYQPPGLKPVKPKGRSRI